MDMGRTYTQSRFYRAPEVLFGRNGYTTAIDLWSVGCIMAELFAGEVLFLGSCQHDQVAQICSLLGMPPASLLQKCRHADKFFVLDGPAEAKALLPPEQQREMLEKLREAEDSVGKWKAPAATPQHRLGLPESTLDTLGDSAQRGAHPDRAQRHAFVDMVKHLLVWEPERRVTAELALRHCFWAGEPLPEDPSDASRYLR